MRKIGFTGTRERLTFEQHSALQFWMEKRTAELRHGDCVGADEAAHDIAHSLRGWRIVIHPGPGGLGVRAFCAGYNVLCPVKPNLERNSDIVEAADEMVAAPKGPEEVRSGTWSTIRKARRSGKPLTIFWPDGSMTHENAAEDFV